MKPLCGLLTLFLFCVPFAEAKLFQNSYVSFDIPDTWECKAFGTDWICHSKFQEKRVEALITSTAKIAGPNDTLEQYRAYLQESKTWANIKKEQITSEKVTPAKQIFINKFPWVDSIHKNSEVKSYISRYAGTVCCKDSSSQLGILIVLSAHQDHYTKYSKSFLDTVKSLRVLDIEKAIPKVRASQLAGSGEGMSSYLSGLFEDEGSAGFEGGSGGGKVLGMDLGQWSVLILILLAGLTYFLIKGKGKRGRRRRRRRHHR